jgi:hypothetical protein
LLRPRPWAPLPHKRKSLTTTSRCQVRFWLRRIDADSQVNIRDGKLTMPEYSLADEFQVPAEKVRTRNWAQRPAHGATYGATYIADYREKIAELFNRGVEQSSNKQSPAAMQQLLEAEFPNRYSLPQENELRQEISKLFKQQKENDKKKIKTRDSTSTSATGTTGTTRRKLPSQYISFLSDLLDADITIKPKDAIERIQNHNNGNFFVVPDGIETEEFDKKVFATFNNLKVKKKKEQH